MYRKLCIDTHNMLYENFEKICLSCNKDEIIDYVYQFRIDVNYGDGYYTELICSRNDLELLKVMISLGSDIHLNNEGILRSVAHEGYIELTKYLIEECNSNYKILYESTAGSNKKETRLYLQSINK
jgi:hypothetical protein